MKFKIISFVLFLFLVQITLSLRAQLITTNPLFPADISQVEITFNAALGNGGLQGYTGDVYAHTGVITNLSTGPSDWKYVKTSWGQNTSDTKLERIGTDLYKLTISPNIRQYYGVPASEQILKLAFVFRSGVQVSGSWLEGKTDTGGDIFAEVYPEGLFTRIILPSSDAILVNPGELIPIQAAANTADSMFMYIDNTSISSVAGNSLTYDLTAETSGKHYIRIKATNAAETAFDSLYYFVLSPVTELPLPEGIMDGITYTSDTSAVLCLFAPGKSNVFAVGDFNNWEFDESGFMYQTPDGLRFWKTIEPLTPGQEYIFQYIVDGTIRIGDPYATKVSDPWNDKFISNSTYPGILTYPSARTQGVATLLQTAQTAYNWQNGSFTPPEKTDLVIYELLIRDFLAKHDYATLFDTISYLKRLGINAIELMPVSEFEGNLSWGYNPNYYFAPDKYYGPADDFKRFVDVCHSNGIAVIMDMVLNHSFGTSPMVMLYWDAENNRPAADNPWFNPIPKHDFNVGFDFNHESPATRYLVSRVVRYWIEEFHIDGYRFDLSKGFTQKNTLGNVSLWGQYDASRIAIWKAISDSIRTVKQDAYIILEHFADNSEEKELSSYGMMLWGNSNSNFADAAKGVLSNSNFSWASYKARGWAEPNLVSYMESHDEERIMYRVLKEGSTVNPLYNLRDSTHAMERMQLASVFLLSIPGPKMLWQFGELAYDYTIDYNGRTGEKPIRWDYRNDYRRKALYNLNATMINLRKSYPAFKTTDYTMNVSGYLKKIILNHPSNPAVLVGNFGVTAGSIVPVFPRSGKWYEYFSGDSIDVSDVNMSIELVEGQYKLYTTQKLITPAIGLGINESGINNNRFLDLIYPNPSTIGFTIPVHLTSGSEVLVSIFNASGQLVDIVFDGKLPAGQHTFKWNPGAAKGFYFVNLLLGSGYSETQKIAAY